MLLSSRVSPAWGRTVPAGRQHYKGPRSIVGPASRRRGGVRCRRDAGTTKHQPCDVIGSERVRRSPL